MIKRGDNKAERYQVVSQARIPAAVLKKSVDDNDHRFRLSLRLPTLGVETDTVDAVEPVV